MVALIDDTRRQLISLLIFLIGVFGVTMNSLSMYVVLKNPLLKNSFGILCFSHCIANIGVCSVFLIWTAPLTLMDNDILWQTRLAKHLGQLNILCWDACVYSHLAISFNRFITISFPHVSHKIITTTSTLWITGLVWSLAICHVIPYFWVDECYILYHPHMMTWNFADTECGLYISTYFDFYTGVSVFIVIAILDFTTLLTLRMKNNTIHHMAGSRNHQRRQVELRFFIQACVQGSVFFYELLNFYFVSTLNSDILYVYFTSTFAWEICHALDGVVLFLFQYRIVFSKKSRVITTMTVSNHSMHKPGATVVS